MNGNSVFRDDLGDEYQLQVYNTPNVNGGVSSTLMISSGAYSTTPGLRDLTVQEEFPMPAVNDDLENLRTLVFAAEATSSALRAEVEGLKEVIQKLVDIRKVTNFTVNREDR